MRERPGGRGSKAERERYMERGQKHERAESREKRLGRGRERVT